MQNDISHNLNEIRKNITKSAVEAGRNAADIKVIGVTKNHTPEDIVEGIKAGLVHIGENRVQEFANNIPLVIQQLEKLNFNPAELKWHMIGRLQTNKARKAAELFDVIQSVDSLKLANKLAAIASDLGKTLDVFVEVNTSGEEAKAGIAPEAALDFGAEVASMQGIALKGLMTIGPLTDDINEIRNSFNLLNAIRSDLCAGLNLGVNELQLSMGMSGDYELAVECGTDYVRIGTAIFGQRNYNV